MTVTKTAKTPDQCMKLVFEYLTGSDWDGEGGTTGCPLEQVRNTHFTRPQSLVLLCYLQIVQLKSPSLQFKVEQICDAFGYLPEDIGACRKWAAPVVEKIARCPLTLIFKQPPSGLQREIIMWVAQHSRSIGSQTRLLTGLQGDEFRYPGESGLLMSTIDSLPGLRWQLSLVSQAGATIAKAVDMSHVRRNALEVTRRTVPHIARSWERACQVLAVKVQIPLYLSPNQLAIGMLGITSPVVILPTGIASTFDDDELVFLLGRELGKVLCNQQELLGLLETFKGGADQAGVGILAQIATNLTFDKWRRAAQLSCDRAGLLACQSTELVERVFLKLMGYPLRYARQMPTWTLREIVAEYASFCDESSVGSALDQTIAWTSTVTGSSLPILTRVSEMHKWIDSGEFAEVVMRKSAHTAVEELREIMTPKSKGHYTDDLLIATLSKRK